VGPLLFPTYEVDHVYVSSDGPAARAAGALGPKPVAVLTAALAKQGVSRRTLYRARKEAGVESQLDQTPDGCKAMWRLADAAPALSPSADAPRNYLRDLLDAPPPYRDGH